MVDAPDNSPDNSVEPSTPQPSRYRFDSAQLALDFQWLRTPYPDRLFTPTGDGLLLHGRESLGSWFEQSLVARRQEHLKFRAETQLEFDPHNFQQVAGLVHYYNRHKFHFVGIAWHEEQGRVLTILSCPGDWPEGRLDFPLDSGIELPDTGEVELAVQVEDESLQFYYRLADAAEWLQIGPVLDASVISDEGGRGEHASFTGAFVGMAAFDTSGEGLTATYSHFDYLPG